MAKASDDDRDESFCSIASNDGNGETTSMDKGNTLASGSFYPYRDLRHQSQQPTNRTPLMHRRSQSQLSISTEMAIIASNSPEIKALNLPITPTFPEEINLFVQSENHFLCTPEGSWMDNDDRDDAKESSSNEKGQYMQLLQRQSLEGMITSNVADGFSQKENFSPCIPINNSLGKASNDKVPKPFSKKGNGISGSRPHPHRHSRSSVERITMHRRVSFDSLPSPGELNEILTMAHGTALQGTRRAASCTGSSMGPLFFPSEMETDL